MFKRIILMSALVLGLGATSAQAQSYGYRSQQTDMDFTGPYLGGTVGYGWADIDADATVGGVGISDDADVNGIQGGVLGGYGFQFGKGFDYVWNGYLGLELGYEWSNADGSAFGADINKEDIMLVTLRPGLSWGDTALGYGIVGYSRTRFESGGDDEWVDGMVFGVGTELGMLGPVKTRLEYVYTNYEDRDYAVGATNVSTDGSENALKLGAVYRF